MYREQNGIFSWLYERNKEFYVILSIFLSFLLISFFSVYIWLDGGVHRQKNIFRSFSPFFHSFKMKCFSNIFFFSCTICHFIYSCYICTFYRNFMYSMGNKNSFSTFFSKNFTKISIQKCLWATELSIRFCCSFCSIKIFQLLIDMSY